jgi:hypothetical protein
MDFIERWFGISPDGGSGLLEALYVFAVVNTIMIAVAYWARRRGRSSRHAVPRLDPLVTPATRATSRPWRQRA